MVIKAGWCATAALLLCSQPSWAAKNMRLHGALVAEPCVILAGNETVELNFDTVIDQYLYLNTRTHGKPFKLHLAQCDLSLGKAVKVTFSGEPNAALPGLLAVEGTRGIAIGMETAQGTPLPLDRPSSAQVLVSGGNTLTVYAYVQGEPQALANKSIERGTFSAVATFRLAYE